ncbi:hypothetical protein AGMMS49579_25880 [Spirochaetia bacterium]|nr:hypothetical protein AGMMS49579_25880 [Spirochaetia bacterium]
MYVLNFEPKELVLCVDGVSPISRLFYLRQLNFNAISKKNNNSEFDISYMTPGSLFMDGFSYFLHKHIKIKQRLLWKDIVVTFANDKVPGEAIFKIIQWLKTNINENYTYYISSSSTSALNFAMGINNIIKKDFVCNNIDIKKMVSVLYDDYNLTVNDFLLLYFLTGTNYLPGLNVNIDQLLKVYLLTEKQLTVLNTFNHNNLYIFLNNIHIKSDVISENIAECQHFLDGLQWLLNYHITDNIDWYWFYKYEKSPTLTDLIHFLSLEPHYSENANVEYANIQPVNYYPIAPFHQMLCVIPISNANILPYPFNFVLMDELCIYSLEKEFNIPLNFKHIKKCYDDFYNKIVFKDRKRNCRGSIFKYYKGIYTF